MTQRRGNVRTRCTCACIRCAARCPRAYLHGVLVLIVDDRDDLLRVRFVELAREPTVKAKALSTNGKSANMQLHYYRATYCCFVKENEQHTCRGGISPARARALVS